MRQENSGCTRDCYWGNEPKQTSEYRVPPNDRPAPPPHRTAPHRAHRPAPKRTATARPRTAPPPPSTAAAPLPSSGRPCRIGCCRSSGTATRASGVGLTRLAAEAYWVHWHLHEFEHPRYTTSLQSFPVRRIIHLITELHQVPVLAVRHRRERRRIRHIRHRRRNPRTRGRCGGGRSGAPGRR